MAACQGREDQRMRNGAVAGLGRGHRSARARPAAASAYEGAFGVDDLSALRRAAAEHGRVAGLDPGRLGDFVLAVNEVATNAIRHGSSRASLRLWVNGDDVCCEVRGGRWISGEPPSAVPDDTDSLRLWVVWQVCSEVSFSYGPGEMTVRLSMSLAGGRKGLGKASS